MHDRAIGLDRSSNDFIAILEIDNDNFGGCFISKLLADADIMVRFEGLDTALVSLFGMVVTMQTYA